MRRRYFSQFLSVSIILFLILIGMQVPFIQKSATSIHADRAADYEVVFDITSKDVAAQQQVIREAGLIKEAHPEAKVEVVLYGKSLDLILKDKSTHVEDVQKLVSEGVAFRVCHIAMDHHHITESQLIKGVGTVPDGIYEIISKQKQGWGYIKITP